MAAVELGLGADVNAGQAVAILEHEVPNAVRA